MECTDRSKNSVFRGLLKSSTLLFLLLLLVFIAACKKKTESSKESFADLKDKMIYLYHEEGDVSIRPIGQLDEEAWHAVIDSQTLGHGDQIRSLGKSKIDFGSAGSFSAADEAQLQMERTIQEDGSWNFHAYLAPGNYTWSYTSVQPELYPFSFSLPWCDVYAGPKSGKLVAQFIIKGKIGSEIVVQLSVQRGKQGGEQSTEQSVEQSTELWVETLSKEKPIVLTPSSQLTLRGPLAESPDSISIELSQGSLGETSKTWRIAIADILHSKGSEELRGSYLAQMAEFAPLRSNQLERPKTKANDAEWKMVLKQKASEPGGPRSQEVLVQILMKWMPEIKSLYERHLKKDVNLMGTAHLHIVISENGEVKAVHAQSRDLASPELLKAMETWVAKQHFPAAQAGVGDFTIGDYPVRLVPAQ